MKSVRHGYFPWAESAAESHRLAAPTPTSPPEAAYWGGGGGVSPGIHWLYLPAVPLLVWPASTVGSYTIQLPDMLP